MKTKVLYNTNGNVLAWWSGDSNIDLSGNLFVEIEIPQDKVIESIDLSSGEPVPVFKDNEPSETEKIQTLEARIEWIALMTDTDLPEEE